MTDHEFLFLALGFQVGALLQFAAHFAADRRTFRRDRRRLDEALRGVAKRRATRDWRTALAQPAATRDGAA